MFRKLVKATEIEVDGIGYALRFYELKTIRGGQRSCEVLLDAADRIILDDLDVEPRIKGGTAGAGHCLQPGTCRTTFGGGVDPTRQTIGPLATRRRAAPGAEERCFRLKAEATILLSARTYFRGSTASFSCLAMRALTTVLAGILMASPVAGLRPIRALRF